MTLTIVALNPKEQFLEFLDPDLCELTETIEYGGLRTLQFTYKFKDYHRAKELFQLGNKVWIQGDQNLTDCLYVINTEVEQDIYHENQFSFEIEEVLVELNYAPLFSQTELSNSEFRKITTNGQRQVIINWNALNYWFKDYFNIGIVQDCISQYAQRVTITGTQTLMSILRTIEEQTGNVFVTRYEKDALDNTIHRYLDFLNPINITKNWTLNLEYDFMSNTSLDPVTDANDNPTVEDHPWEVTPYTSNLPAESVTDSEDPPTETQTEASSTYDKDDDQLYDYDESPDYTPLVNLDPSDCKFRLTDSDGNVLVADNDAPLSWNCSDAGMSSTQTSCVITLQKWEDILGVTVNNASFAVLGENDVVEPPAYISSLNTAVDTNNNPINYLTILDDNERSISAIPDGSYFEIYDNTHDKVLFRTELNIEIGTVHDEVLDFGFNLENIVYDIDETETYTAVSPVLQLSEDSNLSNSDLSTIITNWKDLTVNKGDTIPMIVERTNVQGSSPSNAASNLGTYGLSTNYYTRPLKPQDNTDSGSSSNQYEFYRARAYWKAPYTKHTGELHITTDKKGSIQYQDIYTRTDIRDERNTIASPKMGITESTDENKYAIYNQVATYLREHETPDIDISVDVANLIGHEYNQYNLHDKMYIKIPDTQELMTARVTKTTKEAHDVAKNSIEISNYKALNTLKTTTDNVYIESNGAKFTYPRSGTLTAQLINIDYDNTDYYSVEHPANKLLTFTIYETGSSTITGVYTKKTDANGYATITIDLDPGDYDVEISFTGDEVYNETSLTVKANVAGTIDTVPEMTKKTKTTQSKTTSKVKTTTKTEKTYFNKCGVSPDKKQICSVAKPSASVSDAKYRGVSMTQWYKTIFKNKCPECGRTGTLRFDGGKANKCITSSTYGHPWKDGVPEHEITCIKCDSDYDGVTGLEKNTGHSTRLTTVEKPKKATKADVGTLVKGKMVYKTTTKTVTSKNTTNTKNRYIRASGISNDVKKQAEAIVNNSTGLTAFKKIASWIDRHIAYAGYANFQRSPSTCLKKGSANCCDGTRLLFTLADAAGLSEYFSMYYIHVSGHVYGQVVTKKTGKKRYVDTASDYAACWGYICRNYRGKSQVQSPTLYPKLPF